MRSWEVHDMDFRLGPQADEVRREIRTFLAENFSEEDRKRAAEDGGGHDWDLYRKLAAGGWVSAGWPKEFGGQGRDPYEILTLYWELCKAGFPWIGLLNNGFIGHTLMAMGTDQQRTEVVPRIASGEIAFALGYTEPGSGSDVAGARTQATRDGDDWIIDGQKMWTTTGHTAQYIFMLTRTSTQDRPHRGLTIFLVPTFFNDTATTEIYTMGGERSNGVYLTKVRVPDSARVGEVDKAWSVVRFALGLEQAMGYADLQERFIQNAGRWALEEGADGQRPFDDDRIKEQLGQTAIHAEVSRLLRHRSTWLQDEGLDLGGKGAMTKSFSGTSYLDDAQQWMDLVGPAGLIKENEDGAIAEGNFDEAFRQTPVNTIYGGTVEILRSLVAEVELGLPKSR
jgi:alkylation response protein AidB-like acyl-CoA dehydrogenase